jgi:porphobilinogen synthase
LIEAELDYSEGADMMMVKPALSYLDIIKNMSEKFNIPITAYQVSGEYAMIKFAARAGAIDEKKAILESLTSIRRAGASLIFTYFANDLKDCL